MIQYDYKGHPITEKESKDDIIQVWHITCANHCMVARSYKEAYQYAEKNNTTKLKLIDMSLGQYKKIRKIAEKLLSKKKRQ